MDTTRDVLMNLFNNRSVEDIENIIRLVEETSAEDSDVKLGIMIDFLSHTGTEHKAEDQSTSSDRTLAEMLAEQDLLDEAAGYNTDEEKSENVYVDAFEMLLELLPDADPSYLSIKANELGDFKVLLEQFIENAYETKDYPRRDGYIKRENTVDEETEKKNERMRYTSNLFDLDGFLKEYPNATEYFLDPKRSHALADQTGKEPDVIQEEEDYAISFLCAWFSYQSMNDILKEFNQFGKDVVKASMSLMRMPRTLKQPRQLVWNEKDLPSNVLLMKEIAFVRHHEEIEKAIKAKQENIGKARECCICGDELAPENSFICGKGCVFCKDCIQNGIEVAISNAKTDMGCLMRCGGDFALRTLQVFLDAKTFEHFCQKNQMAEIENAQIDGLEYCIFCSKFAAVVDPNDKIFHCDLCQKDTCRECNREDHFPLKCRQIEHDEDVVRRTYIENQMTDALVRKCYNCKRQYIKNEGGCNKITCDCGAMMCYLCGNQISNYDHFGEGTCPLYTDDATLHIENVREGAARAKADLGVDINPELLKFDPSENI